MKCCDIAKKYHIENLIVTLLVFEYKENTQLSNINWKKNILNVCKILKRKNTRLFQVNK